MAKNLQVGEWVRLHGYILLGRVVALYRHHVDVDWLWPSTQAASGADGGITFRRTVILRNARCSKREVERADGPEVEAAKALLVRLYPDYGSDQR